MIKISVIIPVYNAASYVEKCLQSVFSQTESEVEVILVDDRSSDGSLQKIDALKRACPDSVSLVVCVHDHNRGTSAARNTAIAKASGKYIYFLDSDDWLPPTCLETLYKQAEAYGADVCSGSYVYVRGNGEFTDYSPMELEAIHYSSNEKVLEMFSSRDVDVFMACNKLILRKLVVEAGLLFKEGLLHEDNLWSFNVAMNTSSWVRLATVTYYYRRDNPDSMSVKMPVSEVVPCYCSILQEMRKVMRMKDSRMPARLKQFAKIIHNFKKSILWIVESDDCDLRECYKTFRKSDDYWKNNIGYRHLSLKDRCFAFAWSLPYPLIRWTNPYYLMKLMRR